MIGMVWQSVGRALQKLVCSGLQKPLRERIPSQGWTWTLSDNTNAKILMWGSLHIHTWSEHMKYIA